MKGSEDTLSIESSKKGGDVYLDSTSTQSKSDVWLIDLGVSFHMNPHREWFYEYERYNRDVFLSDGGPTKITRHQRLKLLLNNGIIKTLPSLLHIPDPAKNLISIRKWMMQVLKLYSKKIDAKWFEEKWH